jgi:hypothetical protein
MSRPFRNLLWIAALATIVSSLSAWALVGGAQGGKQADPLAEPFKGITTNGTLLTGLFPVHATGVSTRPVRDAATRFIASLTPEQRNSTVFPVDGRA